MPTATRPRKTSQATTSYSFRTTRPSRSRPERQLQKTVPVFPTTQLPATVYPHQFDWCCNYGRKDRQVRQCYGHALGHGLPRLHRRNFTDGDGHSVHQAENISITLRRTNDIEAEMQLKFSGSISAVTVDGTQKNSVVYVWYRYKKTSESNYGSYTSIYSGTTKSGTSFSYANLELCNLDANSSYDFHLQIQDTLYSLSSLDLYFTVPQGIPLIALRKEGRHQHAGATSHADVAGDMRVDGSPSQILSFSKGQAASGITVNGKAVQRNVGVSIPLRPPFQRHGACSMRAAQLRP